jgi:hypothetical protein
MFEIIITIFVICCRYKPEGRGLEIRLGEILNLPNPSDRTRPWVYSASNRNKYRKHKKIMLLGSKVRPVRGADKLTAIYEPIVLTVWDPICF